MRTLVVRSVPPDSLWDIVSNCTTTAKVLNLPHTLFNDKSTIRHGEVWQIGNIFKWTMFVFGATAPQWAKVFSFTRSLDHTQRRTAVCKTPLNEWSARRRDLYPTKHNTHNRQTSMLPAGFEPIISAGERLQTDALGRTANGTGKWTMSQQKLRNFIQGDKKVSVHLMITVVRQIPGYNSQRRGTARTSQIRR
jgi:hypothetical protein